MMLDLFDKGSILIDPGAGTYSQMCRKYGSNIEQILSRIQCIWVSHKHPDHHNGIIPLLAKRQQSLRHQTNTDPIIIIGPRYFEGYLREVSMTSSEQLKYKFYYSSLLLETKHELSEFFQNFGLVAQTLPVMHCMDAHGLVLHHQTGWKLVLSGDTRPSKRLVELGKNCTLLVYEATMKDKDIQQALKKGHSTISESLHMAHLMSAYRVVLTHFSQRQHDIPVSDLLIETEKPQDNCENNFDPDKVFVKITNPDVIQTSLSKSGKWDESEKKIDLEHVIVAFDLMSINFKHLPHLPKMLSALKCLYLNDCSVRK